jgi:hypothetical protein
MLFDNVVHEELCNSGGRVGMGNWTEVSILREAIHHNKDSGFTLRGW